MSNTDVLRPDVASLLQSLPEGAEIEAGAVMQGVTSQKLCFKLSKKNTDTGMYQLDVQFYGIHLSRLAAKVQADDKILWAVVS